MAASPTVLCKLKTLACFINYMYDTIEHVLSGKNMNIKILFW